MEKNNRSSKSVAFFSRQSMFSDYRYNTSPGVYISDQIGYTAQQTLCPGVYISDQIGYNTLCPGVYISDQVGYNTLCPGVYISDQIGYM